MPYLYMELKYYLRYFGFAHFLCSIPLLMCGSLNAKPPPSKEHHFENVHLIFYLKILSALKELRKASNN